MNRFNNVHRDVGGRLSREQLTATYTGLIRTSNDHFGVTARALSLVQGLRSLRLSSYETVVNVQLRHFSWEIAAQQTISCLCGLELEVLNGRRK